MENVRSDKTFIRLIEAARKVSSGSRIFIHPESAQRMKAIFVEGATIELCTLIGKELDSDYTIMFDEFDSYGFVVVPLSNLLIDSFMEVTKI